VTKSCSRSNEACQHCSGAYYQVTVGNSSLLSRVSIMFSLLPKLGVYVSDLNLGKVALE